MVPAQNAAAAEGSNAERLCTAAEMATCNQSVIPVSHRNPVLRREEPAQSRNSPQTTRIASVVGQRGGRSRVRRPAIKGAHKPAAALLRNRQIVAAEE